MNDERQPGKVGVTMNLSIEEGEKRWEMEKMRLQHAAAAAAAAIGAH